ncbi:MAG: DUF1080 domain-containing protein [Kiritimatiellales bacterium]|nr:DUF1080 domain-containing protein [Kiritimatiellales bacterium]
MNRWQQLMLAGIVLSGTVFHEAQAFTFVLAGPRIDAEVRPWPCTAEVRTINGMPRLCINGKPTVPMAYKTLGKSPGTNYWNSCLETMGLARDAGLHIYQVQVQLNRLGLPRKLLRSETIVYDDSEINDIINVDSNAYFIIDLGLTPDPYYRSHNQMSETNKYPSANDYSQMVWDYNISGGTNQVHDRQSPLSEKVWRDVELSVSNVIGHLEAAYGDRIVMYWPAFSDIGEWYYAIWNGNLVPGFGSCTEAGFRDWAANKYSTVEALNAAWGTAHAALSDIKVPSWSKRVSRTADGDFFNPDTDRYAVDFFDFFNGTMNYGATRIAAYIKGVAGPNKLVGMFWQYLHPLAKTSLTMAGLNHSGHLKLMELLECPDIDVLGTPLYPEVDHWTMPFHGTVDTIQQHGKLFWHENDMATHLSLNAERSSGIGETLKVYAYDFQEWIARQCGFWFFDIVVNGESWSILNDTNIWNYVAERNKYWENHCLATNITAFAPEIAVIRNEKTARYMVSRNPVLPAVYSADKANTLTQMIQHIVEVRDTPVGWYMLDDFIAGNIPSSVKMYIFADTFVVDRNDALSVLARLDAQPGCMAVWFYAPGYVDPRHLAEQTATSEWFVNRLTGGIRPGVLTASIRDWATPVAHGLTTAVPAFGTGNTNFKPQFYIRSGLPGVESLAVYADDTSKIAAAISPGSTNRVWDSVYICSPAIAPELLANLVDRLGLKMVDGFNDATLAQWTVSSGSWAVAQGELHQTNASGAHSMTLSGYTASNLVMEADIRLSGSGWAGLQFRKTQEADPYTASGYLAHLGSNGMVTLYKPGGAIASAWSGFDPTQGFVRVRVEAIGGHIDVYANGNLVINATDATYANGYAGLGTSNNGSAIFDRVSVAQE